MKLNKSFYSLIIILLVCSCFYVYAEKSIDYDIDEVQIQCLFESEQVILESYSLRTDIGSASLGISENNVVIPIVKSISETDELLEVESIEVEEVDTEKDKVFRFSDIFVDSAEKITLTSLSNIRIDSLEEEYFADNKLASRNIEDEIGNFDESHYEKLYRLFGSNADNMDGRVLYYDNDEEARKDMRGFFVTVWDLNSNNEWYQRKHYLMSHYDLVDTLKCIFSELLELPEEDRVPIKSMGCYHYREGSSAHTCGAAIDINWEENAEMTIDGVITCGYFWKPGENIYSIKPDSPFVHVFEKYGWTWGGYWTSKKDYMHFSYIDR